MIYEQINYWSKQTRSVTFGLMPNADVCIDGGLIIYLLTGYPRRLFASPANLTINVLIMPRKIKIEIQMKIGINKRKSLYVLQCCEFIEQ